MQLADTIVSSEKSDGHETDRSILSCDGITVQNSYPAPANTIKIAHMASAIFISNSSFSMDDIEVVDLDRRNDRKNNRKIPHNGIPTRRLRKNISRQDAICLNISDIDSSVKTNDKSEASPLHDELLPTGSDKSQQYHFEGIREISKINCDFRPSDSQYSGSGSKHSKYFRNKTTESENSSTKRQFHDMWKRKSGSLDFNQSDGQIPSPTNVPTLNETDSQNSLRLNNLVTLKESNQERASATSSEGSPLPHLHRFLEKSHSSDKILASRNSRHRLFQRPITGVHIPELAENDIYKLDSDRRESLLSNILITRERRRESSLSDLCNELVGNLLYGLLTS